MEARALEDTMEARDHRVRALIMVEVSPDQQGALSVRVYLEAKDLDNMRDPAHMGQEASLDLLEIALMEDPAHIIQEAFLGLMVIALMEDQAHMPQGLIVTALVVDLVLVVHSVKMQGVLSMGHQDFSLLEINKAALKLME